MGNDDEEALKISAEQLIRIEQEKLMKLAYNQILNHVGVNLDSEPGPKYVQSENQAKALFGEFLGQVHIGEYACEESVCLREP